MNKILVISDTHGCSLWKLMIHIESPDFVVFLGDYWDSFHISYLEQLHNFKEIVEYKKANLDKTILLLGNHDESYILNNPCSGYQHQSAPEIRYLFEENKHLFQMAYNEEDVLFTHAGVSKEWLGNCGYDDVYKAKNIADFVNELWKYKPRAFEFTGFNNQGDNTCQTPIWIRPTSLLKANKDIKNNLIQVVGHTQQNNIDIKGKATGGRYYFTDTLETSGEYILIDNGKFEVYNIKL